ncbi:MAG: hypothetical protein ACFFDF_07865, partial [Candidatus Odinarchaeota archaeon]
TGFGFENRSETLQSLKDELLNNIESERLIFSKLRSSLNLFYKTPQLKKDLTEFLEINKKFGFFYLEEILERIISYLDFIENVIKKNPEIRDVFKLKNFLTSQKIPPQIEENLYLKNENIQIIVFRDFLPYYFKSYKKYSALKDKYIHFHNIFKICRKLKVFNFNSIIEIIGNDELINRIYLTKERKLKESFERFKPYKITNQTLDIILKRFINIGLISPQIINTIFTSSFAKYHPILLLKDNLKVKSQLEKISKFFPRILLYRATDMFKNESVILIFTYFLNIKEKELFSSIIYNLFTDKLINFKRYFTSGLSPFVLVKDFYDFDRNEFYYTKDLFEHSFLYIQKLLGESINPLHEKRTSNHEKFWSKNKNILDLVRIVDSRVSREKSDFNINRINELIEFYNNLDRILLNPEKFKECKQKLFYKNFIKSIKFLPNFQAFGLNQYFLYFQPTNIDEIDLKHLLTNTFQFIKYPNIIDKTNSFLIKYIFPHRNPNIKHLNWYTKTKRIIKEYCLFMIKKVYQILNFNYNISSNGWNYDSNRFKIHMQNVLFNPNYNESSFKIRQFEIGNVLEQDYNGPDSFYYQALKGIYSWKAIDIKSFLGTKKHSIVKNIADLIKNDLIFPYISLKNLGFQDEIYIILTKVKKELNENIIKIFNFFNYGFIYEIEGEFYIYGFNEEVKFENGIMIKLYFPQCEVDEFLRLFDLLFEYLEINKYIILTDLTSGYNLLKNIFEDLSFLDSYNPLINLIWSKKDKIWLNHKLYTEKFEKIYPNLFFGDNR